MDLRDIVEVLAGLDDERRAITNGLQRALDALERAVLPVDRFGIAPGRIHALRERAQHSLPEGPILHEIGDQIRERLVEDARMEGEKLALLAIDSRDMTAAALQRLAERIGGAIDHARSAHEAIGALRALLSRRRDVEAALARFSSKVDADEITRELLELTLAARHAVAESGGLGARAFVLAAETSAAENALLAAIAGHARALRDAVRLDRDPAPHARELRDRVADAARSLWHDRDDARRLLAHVERDAERRREISHGMFQAVTRATEVLERIDAFERLSESQRLADGALGPIKAACLEHGIVSVLVGLHEVSVDRDDLDAALSRLSEDLGRLLGLLRGHPDEAERVLPAWDDIAAVDARTQETEWEAACHEALGVRRDTQGVLSVSPETLSVLVAADSLFPFRDRLFQRIEAKMTDVVRATERLEALDRALSEWCGAGGEISASALACKASLTRFIGEALHVMGECHARFKQRLHADETGFAQVERRITAFARVEDAAGLPLPQRKAALDSALSEVRATFRDLERRLPGDGLSARDSRQDDERACAEAARLQARLAASLAGLCRLRALVLPPLPDDVVTAIAAARACRADAGGAAEDWGPDQLGEALEALLHERLYHEALDLADDTAPRPVELLVSERNRRLLDVVEASVTLAFRLLAALAREHDQMEPAGRDAHVTWMEELIDHVRPELDLHARLLDDVLPDMPDNAARLERHSVARRAVRAFVSSLHEGGAGASLLSRRGTALVASLEAPSGTLGRRILESVRPEEADWRVTSQLESLIDLYEMLLDRLEAEPTRTSVAGSIRALRERAASLRDAILARSEAEDGSDSATGRLFI